MKKKNRNTLILIFIIAVLIAIGFGLNNQKETVNFKEFSVEVPAGTKFMDLDLDDPTIKEGHRSRSDDLTITSFNKQYIENEYYSQNGEKIDFTKSSIENMTQNKANNVTKLSDKLTRCINTQVIDGANDTDVAVIYHDDTHYIIVEGGDVEFITQIAQSIKIIE